MTELVRERGVGAVTVAHVVARSGVSRRTFYELFEDREGCFARGVRSRPCARGRRGACRRVSTRGRGWRERIRAGLGGRCWRSSTRSPQLGGCAVVDALARRAPRCWSAARECRVGWSTRCIDALACGARRRRARADADRRGGRGRRGPRGGPCAGCGGAEPKPLIGPAESADGDHRAALPGPAAAAREPRVPRPAAPTASVPA